MYFFFIRKYWHKWQAGGAEDQRRPLPKTKSVFIKLVESWNFSKLFFTWHFWCSLVERWATGWTNITRQGSRRRAFEAPRKIQISHEATGWCHRSGRITWSSYVHAGSQALTAKKTFNELTRDEIVAKRKNDKNTVISYIIYFITIYRLENNPRSIPKLSRNQGREKRGLLYNETK